MSFRVDEFKTFYILSGTSNSAQSYASTLRKLDAATGGLDEQIDAQGFDAVMDWAEQQTEGYFAQRPGDLRSALRKYGEFLRTASNDVADDINEALDPTEARRTVFKYENELQAAVRTQLSELEAGLNAIDNGFEASFSTGRTDILARDADDCAVIIELKAGPCPKGALEQVLGYAQSLIEEKQEPRVRMIVVAGEFNSRQKAAAKLIPNLELRIYELGVRFTKA